jgi:glycosyltransferase involved in cell wall biosynthesis
MGGGVYKVTVFIPTFNRLEMLKHAVKSVIEQGNFVKLHILDNASSDGTQEWLIRNFRETPNVKLILREENVGGLRNFQEGFESVETDYCVPLADDDALVEGFLETALQVAEAHSDLGAVICQTKGVEVNQTWIDFSYNETLFMQPKEHVQLFSEKGHYISWSSILWNYKKIRAAKCIEDFNKYGLPSDIWFQFKFIAKFPCAIVSRPGAIYSIHPNQASEQIDHRNIAEFGRMNTEIREYLQNISDYSNEEINDICANLNKRWCGIIESRVNKKINNISKDQTTKAILDYISTVAPNYGYSYFPLNSLLISKYIGQNTSNRIIDNKIISMERSLSWKITSPLRWIDNLIQQKK